jgi:hydroxyacylglutathione hydrolase
LGAVCDPLEDIEPYLRISKETGLKVRCVIDTHVHADHVSGARKLVEATGAEYVLHSSVGAKFQFRSVADGEELVLGNVQLRVLHTPGHTPEHISVLVTDRTRGIDPWFVLSGHTLMVGDMRRTKLASSAEDGARALFHSAGRLRELPDYLEVLPGAFSGSVCGRSLSGKPASTIGFERKFNAAFRIEDEDAFMRHMLQSIPTPPPEAAQTRAINLGVEPESK